MNLRQRGFTYSACGPFKKNKKRMQEFKETRDLRYIYQDEIDKACFQHNIAYRDFKDLTRTTASDKILHDKGFNIAKKPKDDGYQRGPDSMVYRFFDKKFSVGDAMLVRSETLPTWATQKKSAVKNENISNKELAEELHKQIIRMF